MSFELLKAIIILGSMLITHIIVIVIMHNRRKHKIDKIKKDLEGLR